MGHDDAIRVVLYSHDSQGLGHLRRNLALAHHLADHLPTVTGRGVSGLIVTGLTPDHGFRLPSGFDWLTLPGVAKTDLGYGPRSLGVDTDALRTVRSHVLDAALLALGPDLVIIDRHPYGVWHELRTPLHHLRLAHPGARVVLGLREVLDSPDAAAAEWVRLGDPGEMRRLVDQVWVYGDPAVHDPVATAEIPPGMHDRVRYTGYLARGRRLLDHGAHEPSSPFILTTAGGGSDGHALLRTAARMTPPAGHEHIVVTGPQLDRSAFEAVREAAAPSTRVHRSWPGLSHQIAAASAVISMGGYNTVCEILDTSTPALVVPRERPRLEQLIRARALSDVGAVELLRLGDLDSAALSRWSHGAVRRRVERHRVDGTGLQTVPLLAARLLGHDEERCAPRPPALTPHPLSSSPASGRTRP